MIRAHLFLFRNSEPKDTEGRLLYLRLEHAPRVGDELRLNGAKGDEFYVVKRLVWCLDEHAHDGQRLNIEAHPTP
jgi:hypothetical protein